MQLVRPAIALDSRRFGKRFVMDEPVRTSPQSMGDDIRLFATTFLAGFIFVSVFLA